ncbi:MAG TPA: holo-ACP synthase, partial [Methylophilaceae bacterium]|nr:holo-ACP synthase [Methylophilaceae bacterium]
ALGTGLRPPATFQNIAVSHDALGKPVLILAGELQDFLQSKNIVHMHITISDEKNLAAAFVILEM